MCLTLPRGPVESGLPPLPLDCACVCIHTSVPCVCVCVCVHSTVSEGCWLLMSWPLATGGLGVTGVEPACGLPYPTPGPPVCRGAAEGRPPRVMCPPLRPSRGRAAAPVCPRAAALLLPALLYPLPLPRTREAVRAPALRRA